jgi:hypothetical protein
VRPGRVFSKGMGCLPEYPNCAPPAIIKPVPQIPPFFIHHPSPTPRYLCIHRRQRARTSRLMSAASTWPVLRHRRRHRPPSTACRDA